MKLLPVPLAPVSLPPPPSSSHLGPSSGHHLHHHLHSQQQHMLHQSMNNSSPGGLMPPNTPTPYSPSAASTEFSFWRYPNNLTTAAAYAAAAAAAGANGGPFGAPSGGPGGVSGAGPLPPPLGVDPRLWGREDVAAFLRWCEREFDLREFDMDAFQMNGKAMCLLTKTDLSERCPGAGDVLYNALQMLVRDAALLQRCLPGSPVTPTSRHHPWPHLLASAQDAAFHGHLAAAAHFASQQHAAAAAAASVALSPAPSLDSQQGSPQHADQQNNASSVNTISNTTVSTSNINQLQSANNTAGQNANGAGQQNGISTAAVSVYQSNGRSDSEDDDCQDTKSALALANGVSPPGTPGLPPPSGYMSFSLQQPPPRSPVELKSPAPFRVSSGHGEFFQGEPSEPNTNGRLLWDFLQQLLNDSSQRYTNYIAWKNIETGVFKIVDPAGLAKLWGIQKNHLSMNYDKMSRALRYYYRVNILRKVQGERHCYQFLRNPSELKNIKNISLLRQQMSPTRPNPPTQIVQQQPQVNNNIPTSTSRSPPTTLSPYDPSSDLTLTVKTEPRLDDIDVESENMDDEMPTDLSMMSSNNGSGGELRATDLSAKFDRHRISTIVGGCTSYDNFKSESDSK